MPTLSLNRPQGGSTRTLQLNTLVRRLLGGQLQPVRPSSWPSFRRFHFEFVAQSRQEVEDFVDFVKAAQGEEVTVTDQYGEAWAGVIISEAIPLTQTHRNIDYGCSHTGAYTLSFDFEGSPA